MGVVKTHLELFAGIGGIALASEWAGFEHVGFVEKNKFCQKVLAKNFPGVPIYDDVTTFDGTKFRGVDLISGGFPCQPHSLAGSRKASGDERDLWGEVVRIVGEAKPRWFLGENVPGLFSSESGRFFGRVVDDLAALRYRVGWAMYGASDVGAVHRRNRVFIVAYSDVERTQVQVTGGLSAEQLFGSEGATGGTVTDTQHDGSPRGAFGRGTSEGEGVRRMPQPQGRTFTGDWREWGISPTVRLERGVRGSNDGIPNRVDRLKALGNAVVPQQIYPILRAIAEAL